MTIPRQPKIYHIVHVDRLPSIIADGFLWSDAEMIRRSPSGTAIGMKTIKHRRLHKLKLASHPDLHVGECVPFYFCPRSIMLFMIFRQNHPELSYRGGQDSIIHLEADLNSAINWISQQGNRWAFTLSNAGTYYFEDRCDLNNLHEIDWEAIQTNQWSDPKVKEGKQAEFLVERSFSWRLITRIGVNTSSIYQKVMNDLSVVNDNHPSVELRSDWYY